MAPRLALGAMLVVALLGCSSADDGAEPTDSLGVTAAPTKVTAPPAPSPSPAGTGVVVIGGTSSSFAVIDCLLEPDGSEPAAAQTLLLVTGTGTTGGGVAFEVAARRFATGTDPITYTDTIGYQDTARILQAQRIEVGGQVDDLRDPDATTSLLRPRADGLSAVGLAGPPGAGAGADGTVGIALDATCP
ncbi:MAG: hypothetical protein ACSLFP_10090 [Acidimicrobiales bacterium]